MKSLSCKERDKLAMEQLSKQSPVTLEQARAQVKRIKDRRLRTNNCKIERGILSVNSNNEIIVSCPMSIYKISEESLLERDFKSNEKLFGVIVNNVFHKCDYFKLKNDIELYGYIMKNDLVNSTLCIQAIVGFHERTFDQYNSDYLQGKEITVSKNEITNFYRDQF